MYMCWRTGGNVQGGVLKNGTYKSSTTILILNICVKKIWKCIRIETHIL